jgi:protein O-GlcNAc transferase
MQHADLFLDTLRINANQGLEDALRLGVPAITCAGDSMASRMGGKHAAGGRLAAVRFGNADMLRRSDAPGTQPRKPCKQLRDKLRPCAKRPLFDLPPACATWESAWATMAERTRAGLHPQPLTCLPANPP